MAIIGAEIDIIGRLISDPALKGLILNPLNLHEASKHHFAYLKNDSIPLKPMGFRTNFFNGTAK